MTPPTRLLALGIDAANPGLLRRWAADGTMPNLGALMRRGLVGETRGLEGFLVGATWPSLYTGVSPARHGFHYTVQLKPGSYEYHHPGVEHEPFWAALSRAAKRVAIIDVPLTELDRGLNGMHIVDWSGIEALYAFNATPPDVRDEVLAKWGPYPLRHSCDGWRRSLRDWRTFLEELERGVEMRGELTRHFLAKGGWDLFMQVFTEPHCAGHQVWHLHDPSHPAHDPAMAAALGDPLRRIYAAVDRALGPVIEAAGDVTVMVFTAHGMSYWYGAQFVLPGILERLGVTVPLRSVAEPAARPGSAVAVARRLWRMLPRGLREAVRPPTRLQPRIEDLPPLPASLGADPARSKCFVVRNGHLTAGIRLNLVGREPAGVIAPGAEADTFCRTLARDLMEIVDERTGRPVFRRITRTADLFQGDRLGDLPDLLLDWDDAVPTGSTLHSGGAAARVRVHSARIGTVEGSNEFSRTGDHRIEGMFIAAGPGIRGGTMDRVVSTLDLAPTLAGLVGVRLEAVDGREIEEVGGRE